MFFFALVVLFWIAVPVGLFLFGRRLLRSLDRRTVSQSDLAALSERLRRLEERVEDIGSETERISESSRFASALLAGPAKEDSK
jgi:hypothetical protein